MLEGLDFGWPMVIFLLAFMATPLPSIWMIVKAMYPNRKKIMIFEPGSSSVLLLILLIAIAYGWLE